ncbi:MAG TPA: hypothetical protein VIC05_07885 [Solirubrobacteraceae bacterium]
MSERDCSPAGRDRDVAVGVGERDDLDDGILLTMLLDSEPPGLWSVEEVVRALGNRTGAADSLMRLERDGLIHRHGEFVFATRAAIRAREIEV